MQAAWTETEARLEFQRRADVMAAALTEVQAHSGDALASFACMLSQQQPRHGARLQIWRRAEMPSQLRAMIEQNPPKGGDRGRLALLLRALDGRLWIMWPRVVVTAPGGDA